MSKVKVRTLLKKEGKEMEHHFLGIKQDNKLIYHDDMCQVTIDLKKQIMIRENEEFRLEMYFVEGKESQNPYTLKQTNSRLWLDLHTYRYQWQDNQLLIDYQVVGSERIQFELEMNL